MNMLDLLYYVSIGCGTGLFYAPGTIATIAIGIPVTLCIRFFCTSATAKTVFVGVCTISAYMCIHHALPLFLTCTDPQEIVLDEIIGTLFACAWGPQSFFSYVSRIFLFRFFDISKIGIIGLAEQLPGAAGILCDDIVAGIFAHAIASLCGV